MQNLKIKANTAEENKEVQELFFELGYNLVNNTACEKGFVVASLYSSGINFDYWANVKETTLSELRAMVHPMKEYLIPSRNYEYILTDAREALEPHAKDWVEIPEWANYAYKNDAGICFLKGELGFNHPLLIWQRPTQPEALPFIDDNPQSLNEQYAEIEQVRQQSVEATLAERQSTYGNFEDVAFVTENIMSVLGSVRVNGLSELPTTHRMALYMIASKMARIVNGDFNHLDGWHDIGGYSKLIEKLIKGER